jgi:PPE-repeat protein
MSAFGDAAAVPPEVNYTVMSTGDLGASLVSAAAGYEIVADMLMAEMTAMGLNTSTTAMVGWQGPGGVMMQMSAAEFMQACAAASAWARIGQVQAAEVAAAHTMAVEAMIPAPVALANRTSQAALVASNLLGQNTPAIVALDGQYFGEFWPQNAVARTGYGAVVATALGTMAAPPPFSPTAANPAGPAAAVAQEAAVQGGQAGLQAGAKTLMAAADSPLTGAASAPNTAPGMVSQLGGQMGGLLGQLGSGVGQLTQVGGQLPQMLGQAPQMLSGMLGPLSSVQGLGSLSPAAAGSVAAPNVAAAAGAGLPGIGGALPAAGALGALGGGGGGMVGGPAALSSSFVRPASSFSAPTTPTLPAGWLGGAAESGGAHARPAMGGGGGMFGAPAALSRDGHADSGEKSSRSMQLTARAANRGDRQPI